jgi:hypothetical protein
MKYICKNINHQIKKCLLFRCRHALVIMQTLNWTLAQRFVPSARGLLYCKCKLSDYVYTVCRYVGK